MIFTILTVLLMATAAIDYLWSVKREKKGKKRLDDYSVWASQRLDELNPEDIGMEQVPSSSPRKTWRYPR